MIPLPNNKRMDNTFWYIHITESYPIKIKLCNYREDTWDIIPSGKKEDKKSTKSTITLYRNRSVWTKNEMTRSKKVKTVNLEL